MGNIFCFGLEAVLQTALAPALKETQIFPFAVKRRLSSRLSLKEHFFLKTESLNVLAPNIKSVAQRMANIFYFGLEAV